MGQLPSNNCEQVRGYAAASVDGELSEVEAARLESHLSTCAACRRFAANLGEIAFLIRLTPPESLDYPIVLPSRRLRLARALQVSAAAAAVAAVVGVSATVGIGQRAGSTTVRSARSAASLRPEDELRMLRQASLRDRNEHARLVR